MTACLSVFKCKFYIASYRIVCFCNTKNSRDNGVRKFIVFSTGRLWRGHIGAPPWIPLKKNFCFFTFLVECRQFVLLCCADDWIGADLWTCNFCEPEHTSRISPTARGGGVLMATSRRRRLKKSVRRGGGRHRSAIDRTADTRPPAATSDFSWTRRRLCWKLDKQCVLFAESESTS